MLDEAAEIGDEQGGDSKTWIAADALLRNQGGEYCGRSREELSP